VICFINKLDREGRDPYDLLDEVESKLNIQCRPLSWPIGMGKSFKGVYNLFDQKLNLFTPSQRKLSDARTTFENLDDAELDKLIGQNAADQLREDVELIEGVYPEFDTKEYLEGKVAPVFFGSAVNNFGVNEMLDTFIKIAPAPKSRNTDTREVLPSENKFSGFVFKIHANMDPNHRNRIAFLRICSGEFQRNKPYKHVLGPKPLRFSNVTQFMAQDKEIIDTAYPGDIIGLYDTGNLKIGDTLTDGEEMVFTGIPSFSPEIFREVVNKDAMKTKQLEKGLKQLMEEGVAQLFTFDMGSRKVVGTVGQLQFEVIQFRLKNEYNATVEFHPMNLYKACWISSKDKKQLDEFVRSKNRHIAHDKDGKLVFMAESKAWLQMVQDNYPDIEFHFTSEF